MDPEGSFNLKKPQKFIGSLVQTTHIVPHLKCYISSLYCWETEWQVPSAKRKIPTDVREDLNEWQSVMKTLEPRRIIPDQVPVNLNWLGDASLSGIGVLIGEKCAQFDLVKGWNDD